MKIALIGLGAIGVPIAHKLNKKYKDDFFLIADNERKKKLKDESIKINDEPFKPLILSESDFQTAGSADILIVCVKNYSLSSIFRNINPFIDDKTIILPLQNGIYAYDFFTKRYPLNLVLRGYVQGPNTERVEYGYKYENPGDLHIGSDKAMEPAKKVADILKSASIPVFYEDDIVKMVWKKWMLNIAGNSVTALTGADYSLFKLYSDLQNVCRQAMKEFMNIAIAEGIKLNEGDIEDIIKYYVSYVGSKKTSMLMDVFNESKTENDYLAGAALQLAKKHNINAPIISTLYYLMEVKEEVYMEKNGCRATDLYTEGVEYSDALRVQMNDLDRKMKDKEYASVISRGLMPKELKRILQYAVDNSSYYSSYSGFKSLQDFPVMDKERLKREYDKVLVHKYDQMKTHIMYTSGSKGTPFAVIQDLAKRERNIADLKYFGNIAGYIDHDPMCYLRARPVVTEKQQEKDNIWQLDISSLSKQNLSNYFHLIVEKKCRALVGNASTLRIAVEYWGSHFENESSVKTIISTSEALSEHTRQALKDFFGGEVRIYSRYSNSEQGILGQEANKPGEFVLNWASYYFEILKADSDERVKPGETGRIVVTDMYNKAFPMIRYDTGDLGMLLKDEEGFPRLAHLSGRKEMDLIYDVKGEPVSPFLISRTLRRSKGVKQWKFLQKGRSTYILNISCEDSSCPRLENEIRELKKTLGEEACIELKYNS
ncbi:MAG: 2-dehydropantoate 2-reductase [Lachnospiraceae bacterium]|nr:2-dehydropantoate 2-reductase [Lachnospiraceae bacterium]